MNPDDKARRTILWFDQISSADSALVGKKNVTLGEMYTQLTPEGILVPNGFVVTAHAYQRFIAETDLGRFIEKELDGIGAHDTRTLTKKSWNIRRTILRTAWPRDIADDIQKAYKDLSRAYQAEHVDVAVKASHTEEGMRPAALEAYETLLNISGERELLAAIVSVIASSFHHEVLADHIAKGIRVTDVSFAVGVQKMVRSDKSCAGEMTTCDPDTGFPHTLTITSSWGIGTSGRHARRTVDTHDEFIVFKPTIAEGFASIVKKTLGGKQIKVIHARGGLWPAKEFSTTEKERKAFTLSDDEIANLARWGIAIEQHYSRLFGQPAPMNVLWAKDGVSKALFVVGVRRVSAPAHKGQFPLRRYTLIEKGERIISGMSIVHAIGSGKARVIRTSHDLQEFRSGEVLVATITDPEWEPAMRKAAAVVIEKGGNTSHAAVVARELGIPAIVGVAEAARVIKNGEHITVDCTQASAGIVYRGLLKWQETVQYLSVAASNVAPLSLSLANPEGSFASGMLPHHGAGLISEEFIIVSHIGIHPLALINCDTLPSKTLQHQIRQVTAGYRDKKEFYIDRLASGIARMAIAAWPEQSVVRFSDFGSDEYGLLAGGEYYETSEENPLLGVRGVARYTHNNFRKAFQLECEAIKRVRSRFGLKHVAVMVPFCRTPEEGRDIIRLMREYGLARGDDGLRVYLAATVPANIIRADEFLDIFDGFSLDMDSLLQTVFGIDGSAASLSHRVSGDDQALRMLAAQAIAACKRRGKYIGVFGQVLRNAPELLAWLISQSVDAISLDPDTLLSTIIHNTTYHK